MREIFRLRFSLPLVISLIAIVLRLMYVTTELGEVHSWRQADTAMVARNFYRNGFEILYPQIDWAGVQPGYVGTEFPLVPYLTALLYLLFDERFYLGRLVSLFFFVPTLAFLYLLVQKSFGRLAALLALFFYAFAPLSVYYSRTFMPESAMLFFSMAAIFYFVRWGETRKWVAYVLAVVSAAFAILVKATAVVIAFPLAYLAWQRFGWRAVRQARLWLFAFVAVVPSILWYSHALKLARENYPFHMFGERGWIWENSVDFLLHFDLYKTLLMIFGVSVLTPLGIAFAIAGAVIVVRKFPQAFLFHWWAAGHLVFLIVALPAGRHEYYNLQLVPAAAAFAGAYCATILGRKPWSDLGSSLRVRISIGVLLLFVVATSYVSMELRKSSEILRLLFSAGKVANQILPRDAVVIGADWKNPVLIYASNRRGWHFPQGENFLDQGSQWSPALLEELRKQGAQYFIAPVRPSPGRVSFLEKVAHRISVPREFDFLDSYPEFAMYLDRRFTRCFKDEVALIYDLRTLKKTMGQSEGPTPGLCGRETGGL